MKIKINRQDYTSTLDAVRPLTIERRLNEPSVCQLWLSLPVDGSFAAPLRNQAISVTGDDGTIYFTGYIAVSPLPEYAGLAIEGPRYRLAIQALSDELLLDQLPVAPSTGSTGLGAGALISTLVTRTGATALSTTGLTLGAQVGKFVPEPGASWSQSAGQAASQARAAYRAVNGALTLAALDSTVHPLNETDGSLNLANLAFTSSVKRGLANDVTVCGQREPVAYVTEYFLGDGASNPLYLAADPYWPDFAQSTYIDEKFNQPQLNLRTWGYSGGTGYFSLGSGGLAINGGNGIDGQTILTWLDPIELGGTLLLEAAGVTLSPGSSGVLAGLYTGLNTRSACVAGFLASAQSGTGQVTLQPLVGGSALGTAYTVSSANQYTLRVRVHCAECERATAIYRSFGDNGAIVCGGQWNPTPAKLQMEIQEFVNGVGGTPVTLYDGSIPSLPVSCTVVAASSVNLIGSMRALSLISLGSVWVVSTEPGGGPFTRRLGTIAESAECFVHRTGKVEFHSGCAPMSGETIAISYRTSGRSVGRAVNTASQQALALAGLPSESVWFGSVTKPPARTSQDCRNAASAIAQAAASVSALWSGNYKGTRLSFATDVWPGDALQLNAPSTSLNAKVVVRTVKLSYKATYPDVVEYQVTFANDWADDLAIKTSNAVPADAWLPAAANETVLANLTSLSVTSLTATAVTVNTGVAPPPGGGFEIRRRDFCFMPGEDQFLVMRASVQNLTFARESVNDRFYIRMFDGSTPPNYSEFSTALFINLPLGS